MRKILMLLAITFCPLLLSVPVDAAGKINTSMSSLNLAEGASQIIQVSLNAPIICPQESSDCGVDIPWVASDPTRVTINPATVHYSYTQWSQYFTFTVTAVDDSVYYAPTSTITISSTAVSNSVYYNGFQVSLAVTINDNDPEPTPSLTPSPATTATPEPDPDPTPMTAVPGPSTSKPKSKSTPKATSTPIAAVAPIPVPTLSPIPSPTLPPAVLPTTTPSPTPQPPTTRVLGTATFADTWPWLVAILLAGVGGWWWIVFERHKRHH